MKINDKPSKEGFRYLRNPLAKFRIEQMICAPLKLPVSGVEL